MREEAPRDRGHLTDAEWLVRPSRIRWARLFRRVLDIDMQHCLNCGGGKLKIISALRERPVVEKILTRLGLDPQPPPRASARALRQG